MKKVSSVEWLVRLTIVLLLFLCCYLLIKIKPIWGPVLDVILGALTPFFIAALFTYLLHPIIEFMHRHKVPRPLAIVMIYIVFFGGLALAFVKGVPSLIAQLRELDDEIPKYVRMYRHLIQEFYHHTSSLPETVHDHFRGLLHKAEVYINGLIKKIINMLMGLAKHLLTIFVIPVLVFYFLNDYPRIQKAAAAVVPGKWHKQGKRMLKDIDDSLGGYIRGQFFVCFFLAIIATFIFWLLKLPYFVLLGILVGLTDIIPYFGPILGFIPVALVAATVSWKMILYVLGFTIVLHFVEGNFLSPLIVGKSLHMHPIMIIFALFVGGEVGGLFGLLLAVPAFAVIRVVFLHLRGHVFAKD